MNFENGTDKQDAIVDKELHQRKAELARRRPTYKNDVKISKEREREICLIFDLSKKTPYTTSSN